MKISASIVLYNSNIEQLKTAIASYNPSEGRVLYLIDNSPVETDISQFVDNNNFIKYHFMNKNKGYGAGHNVAIHKAIESGKKYHVVLNPDVKFESNIIDKTAKFIDTDDNIAIVTPKMLNPTGELVYSCRLLPTPLNGIVRRFIPFFVKNFDDRYVLKACGYNQKMNVPYLSGCFMFLRLSILKEYNIYFDEKFFMYYEDVDFCRRLHRIGKTIYYPDVFFIHEEGRESYKSMKMLFIHIKSAIKYFNKWGWIFDKERRIINDKTLEELAYKKS
jgi:GT2 family glycosyltransferase